jgi:ElaB/YqjD/DUF883 family membrane-anchored ribosome-binding protein
MDQEPDVIRQQIDETRSSLTAKLETLEGQVRETVHDAKATVEGTIQNVKDSVQNTVQTVKRTFDLRYQTEQHPWPMVSGSVVAGFLLGSLVGGRRAPQGRRHRQRGDDGMETAAPPPERENYARPNGSSHQAAAPSKPGFLSQLRGQFDDEIDKVKEIAVGAAVGILRDLIKQYLPPSLAPRVEEVMDSATTKLGGQPVRGPVLECGDSSGPRR